MSIHTENLARRIAAQLLTAMAEQSLSIADVAKRLSTPDNVVEPHEVRSAIVSLSVGKDMTMAAVAQLAWACGREISPRLEKRDDIHDAVPAEADVACVGNEALTNEDVGRVVVIKRGPRGGNLGLLILWNNGGRASVRIRNGVDIGCALSNLRFATRAEVESDNTLKGVGHKEVYAPDPLGGG
jgi:hypothetical protein